MAKWTLRREVPIMVRLPLETKKDFEKWRKKFGQSKSGFASLCIAAGLKSVIRGVQPEEAMDEGKLVRIIGLLAKSQGVDLGKVMKGERSKQVR